MAASSGCSWFVLRLTRSQACEFRDIPASGLVSVSVVMGRSEQFRQSLVASPGIGQQHGSCCVRREFIDFAALV